MTADYRSWPAPARTMAQAVDAAVSAAQAVDAAAFTETTADLGRVDHEQLVVLLGSITRDLLERSHPDGLDADDAEQVLRSCLESAAPWYGPIDGDALLAALAGALGVSDPDESPQTDGAAVVTHGLLLIADQLTILAQPLPPVLDFALKELMRAQTVELP
ncbi:MAG: hypothetical protein ABJB47_24250 [Actinomycetota bacterium]